MNDSLCQNEKISACIDHLPLAMAYVPMQSWCDVYELQVGFRKGTMFPELDKPFYGAGGVPCYR